MFQFFKGGENVNYFFKFLIPQLMEYFKNDETLVIDFLPNAIVENLNTKLLINREKELLDNEKTNQ